MRQRSERSSERGYTLLATALALVGMIGMTGLAVDVGRMYVVKNEAQTYADAAALRAALELDGTLGGLQRARDAATQSPNRWNFSTSAFSGTTVEFSQSSSGPWDPNPPTAAGYRFVRVRASAEVPISFMRVLAPGGTRSVSAQAAAGQVSKDGFREGLFPFSPFAHNPSSPPNFGLVPGQIYTLRWAASPKLSKPDTLCPGDATQSMIDLAQAGGGEERGYIEETSASVIRKTVVADYQTVYRQIGDSVHMTGGAKQTIRDALVARVLQDSDTTSTSFAQYLANGQGNGRRIVAAPINLGQPGGYRIVQIGAFFLLRADSYSSAKGGNDPFCAEYIGPYVQGSTRNGAGDAGYYVVRLVE
jgi:Flp pilus assembly protein TadG